jgi:hypothetical protein
METRRRIASGANARYFRSLLQLLLSLQRSHLHRETAVLVFDLGLRGEQRRELEQRFPWAEVRDYTPDPALPHLQEIANYGWKPTIIGGLLAEDPRPLLWLDSACVVTDSLKPVWSHAAAHGVWCPYGGSGGLGRWSDPRVLDRLGVGPEHHKLRLRAGGVCAFDLRVPVARVVAETWQRWAADPELLCPPGCKPEQHNYDQTLLTVLLLQKGVNPSDDELDISSTRPAHFLRSRNKVPNWLPLWLDPLARLWFWAYREVDVFLLKRRARL